MKLTMLALEDMDRETGDRGFRTKLDSFLHAFAAEVAWRFFPR